MGSTFEDIGKKHSKKWVFLLNSAMGLFFLLFLCRTENLIIQGTSKNVLIEICHLFNIYYSGIGAS